MKRNPWMKFYPSDWRADPRLRICSLAARGLWMEMLSLMHEAEPYGHLLVSGISPTDAQIGVLAGAPSDQIPELIGELESAGVFSRTKDRVIYSRRMTRDAKKRVVSRQNGKFGGNPSLLKQTGNLPWDNPPDNMGVKPQRPEARGQRPPCSPPPGDASKLNGSQQTPSPQVQFFEFWQAYPRKTAKGGAEVKFLRLVKSGKVSGVDLIAGAKRYAAEVAGRAPAQDGRIPICHPTTWLNQGRWEDEIGATNSEDPTAGFSHEERERYDRMVEERRRGAK